MRWFLLLLFWNVLATLLLAEFFLFWFNTFFGKVHLSIEFHFLLLKFCVKFSKTWIFPILKYFSAFFLDFLHLFSTFTQVSHVPQITPLSSNLFFSSPWEAFFVLSSIFFAFCVLYTYLLFVHTFRWIIGPADLFFLSSRWEVRFLCTIQALKSVFLCVPTNQTMLFH